MEDCTFIMIKPDGYARGLVGEIIDRFMRKGLKLVAMKVIKAPREVVERHYAVHKDRPFYQSVIEYITSGPVVPMVWQGPNVIDITRNLIGATNSAVAAPGTIRGDFGLTIEENIVHGSDAIETAQYEIPIWFKEEELCF